MRRQFVRQAVIFSKARSIKGVTQAQLGDLVGVHPQFVSNWERGLCAPPKEALDRVIIVLEISRKDLCKAMLEDAKTFIEDQVYPSKKLYQRAA